MTAAFALYANEAGWGINSRNYQIKYYYDYALSVGTNVNNSTRNFSILYEIRRKLKSQTMPLPLYPLLQVKHQDLAFLAQNMARNLQSVDRTEAQHLARLIID